MGSHAPAPKSAVTPFLGAGAGIPDTANLVCPRDRTLWASRHATVAAKPNGRLSVDAQHETVRFLDADGAVVASLADGPLSECVAKYAYTGRLLEVRSDRIHVHISR